MQEIPLGQQVDEHCGDRFRSGKEVEERARRGRHERSVSGAAGRIAPRVSDGAIEDHLSAPSNAQPESRMEAGPIEVDHRIPDRFDIVGRETHRLWVHLGKASRGNGFGFEDTNTPR